MITLTDDEAEAIAELLDYAVEWASEYLCPTVEVEAEEFAKYLRERVRTAREEAE